VGTALFFALSLTAGTTHAQVPSVGHALARPLLRHARPLHGHNSLLNITANQGDITYLAAAPPALCATYKHNPYAKVAPNVEMINRDTTVKVGTQKGCKAAQNETTIAVNPENPNNIVAGTNDYRIYNAREKRNDGSGGAYTSQDCGTTWSTQFLGTYTCVQSCSPSSGNANWTSNIAGNANSGQDTVTITNFGGNNKTVTAGVDYSGNIYLLAGPNGGLVGQGKLVNNVLTITYTTTSGGYICTATMTKP